MAAVEYACVFARVAEERLVPVERLVAALPELFAGVLLECDLAYGSDSRFLCVTARFQGSSLSRPKRDRLAFWTARAGGRATAVAALGDEDRASLRANLSACELTRARIAPAALREEAARFFRDAGAPAGRDGTAEPPVLAVDLGGPGREGLEWMPARRLLFVASPLAPPIGDAIPLSLRVPGRPEPLSAAATVAEVVHRDIAGPGNAAGFALRVDPLSPELEAVLIGHVGGGGHSTRAAPRFPVSAPVRVTAPTLTPVARIHPVARVVPVPPPSAAPAHARVEYASEQDLAADWVENLSQGGAFVRTGHPSPVGTRVMLELALPSGVELRTEAMVAFVSGSGMGVTFTLDAAADAVLSAAIAQMSGRPRRVLVVDDDALVRRMLTDALRARGFEVLTAPSAAEGLRTLSEELLALDLLVTDVCMPGMDGEELVRRIRHAGGETELAIVAVSARLEEGRDARLEAAGADAVLDKALGPELVAQASDAVLERKRLLTGASPAPGVTGTCA